MRTQTDEGFTLIELMIVLVIIGLLAAIALPVYLHQQDSARRAFVISDLRETAILLETYYTDYESYPPSLAALSSPVRSSPDNTVTLVSSTASRFCLSVTNSRIPLTWYWQSDGGGLLPQGQLCT